MGRDQANPARRVRFFQSTLRRRLRSKSTDQSATIGTLFAAHARQNPTQPFCTLLVSGQVETLNFEQIYHRAQIFARVYRTRGVKPGDIVIVMLKHSSSLFASFLGAVLVGAVPSFMPYPTPKQRSDFFWNDHERLFDRLRPRLIVTYAENRAAAHEALPNFAIETLVDTEVDFGSCGTPDFIDPYPASSDDVACLQHSSGTTGLKKGVMLSHRAILAHVNAYRSAIDLTPEDRIASWLPLYHDMGFIACFITAVVSGVELIALDPFEWVVRPQILLEAIERFRATLCWLPNFAFSHLASAVPRRARFDLSSIRAFINCSEPCKPATFKRFLERYEYAGIRTAQLHVCYAMAENVFAVTQTRLGSATPSIRLDPNALALGNIEETTAEPGIELLSCGPPIDGVRLRITSNGPQPGEVGEIHVASPFLFDGYVEQPDLTEERLRDGWYATGDLGFVRAGELYVTGRIDDLIIVNGRNYYAHEIETCVSEIDDVSPGRCVAFGVEDERSDATVVVVLAEVLDENALSGLVGRNVRQRVLERLGIAVYTVVVLGRGRLIKTTSGKVSRLKNRELYLQHAFDAREVGEVSSQ